MIDGYVEFFHDALAPVSPLQGELLQRRCIGIIGAAEGLSAATVRGHVGESIAARELNTLIVGWLSGDPVARATLKQHFVLPRRHHSHQMLRTIGILFA
jgi:hypothetical protein